MRQTLSYEDFLPEFTDAVMCSVAGRTEFWPGWQTRCRAATPSTACLGSKQDARVYRSTAELTSEQCCMQGGWQNRILARLANEMSRYNPIHSVPQVKAPVLMVATTQDALCSIEVARRAASLNPLVKLVEKDAGEWLLSHYLQ